MFNKIRVTIDNLIYMLQLISDDLKKIRVEVQTIRYELEDFKKHKDIVPQDDTKSAIDKAFKLKNGLYSFKKVSIRDGE